MGGPILQIGSKTDILGSTTIFANQLFVKAPKAPASLELHTGCSEASQQADSTCPGGRQTKNIQFLILGVRKFIPGISPSVSGQLDQRWWGSKVSSVAPSHPTSDFNSLPDKDQLTHSKHTHRYQLRPPKGCQSCQLGEWQIYFKNVFLYLPVFDASLIACLMLLWTLEMSKFHPDPCLSTETANYKVWPAKSPLKEHLENIISSLSSVLNGLQISTTVIEDQSLNKIKAKLFSPVKDLFLTWFHSLNAVKGLNYCCHLLHVNHPIVVHVVQAEGKLKFVHVFEGIIKKHNVVLIIVFQNWKILGIKAKSLSM